MSERMALCVDSATVGAPELVGLDGEALDAQQWLDVFVTGPDARSAIARDRDVCGVWVVSSDDVDGINLAATLKADRPDLRVCAVRFDADGSFSSRAHTASIDEVLGRSAFVKDYYEAKRRLGPHGASASLELPSPIAANPRAFEQPKRSQQRDGKRNAHAFVLPVVSGSGGAGKSTVAVLGSLAAAQMGYRTLLLDCDLQFGDVASMLGKKGSVPLDEVAGRLPKLDVLEANQDGLAVVAAPSRLEDSETAVRCLPELLEELSGCFDVIVANTGTAWADVHAVLLERSSSAVFLVDQRASSLAACKHAVGLCTRCGIATSQFKYVVNRCSKTAPYTSLDISCALRGSAVFELRDGGRDVEDYLAAGCARDLAQSGNALFMSVEELMARILPDGQAALEKLREQSQTKPGKRRGLRGKQRKRGAR